MKYPIYKPNKNVSGCAGSFNIGQIGQDMKSALFVEMIQQASWDDKKKIGSFKANQDDPTKKINFKLSVAEAGEILSSFKTRVPFIAFHKFDDNTTVIRLTPWDKPRKVKTANGEETHKTPAWGFSVTRNSNEQFKLPLEAGEAEVLTVLLKQFIEDSLCDNAQFASMDKAKTSSASAKPQEKEEASEEEYDDVPF